MSKKQYEKIGGGSYGVYKEKKNSFLKDIGEFLAGCVFIFVILAIIGAFIN
ncbi:MAG: hypothetical protein OEY94_01110 [Alphaproteobacteria bacterium]|nr:hypothetical protein [Alphaproteobacteria bacterium]